MVKQILSGRTKQVIPDPTRAVPIDDEYVRQGLMHPIEYLKAHGLEGRFIKPLRRYGYNYVEDLLGTSPYSMTWEHRPADPRVKYTYHERWDEIPRINRVGVFQMLNAVHSWRAMNRLRQGKGVADTSRVPI